ncbi:MAG TPA: GTPase, partial [Spirochaetia bacterium]|nr:GTPase [Spirochaetia bacterium]
MTSSPGRAGSRTSRPLAPASPARVAILGRPNVGKSSLFNALVGKRRSITHSEPGVTRDPVEESCVLGGVPVLLIDTGGFSPAGEALDRVVSARSLTSAHAADLILFVLDANETTPEDEDFMNRLRPLSDRLLLVVNKVDTPDKDPLVW